MCVCEFMCTVCVHVCFEARRGLVVLGVKREVEQATWSKPVRSVHSSMASASALALTFCANALHNRLQAVRGDKHFHPQVAFGLVHYYSNRNLT